MNGSVSSCDRRSTPERWHRALRNSAVSFLIFTSCVAACCFAPSPGACAEEPNPLDKLIPLWKSQRQEIATAHVRYRFGMVADPARLTPNELDDVLNSVGSASRPEDLKKLNQILYPHLQQPDRAWLEKESYFEGEKNREACVGRDGSYQVFDGSAKSIYSGQNLQIQVFTAGASTEYMEQLTDLRLVPNPDAAIPYRVVGRSPEALQLEVGTVHDPLSGLQTVDPATGTLMKDVTRGQGGRVLKQKTQQGFVTYPGGILFPTVAVEATFGPEERLATIRASVVEEAEFNAPLPINIFSAGVPEGVNVFDKRKQDEVRRAAGLDLPAAGFDRDVVLAKRLGTIQPRLVWLHRLFRQPDAVPVVAGQALHRGMAASPGHPQSFLQDHFQTIQ